MIRVTLITEVATPFRTPLFGALADRVELTVLFLGARDPRRAYRLEDEQMRFANAVLPGRELRRRGAWVVISHGVAEALRRARPDVVVLGGWNQPAFWRALVWARRWRIPCIAWVESTGRDARAGNPPARALKRRFLRRCAAFVVPGVAAAAYLVELGVPADRIVTAPNAVDLTRFRDRVAELRRSVAANSRPLVLTAARLAPEKGLDVLLRAADGLAADVAIAGAGPEEEALRAAAPPNVQFLGQLTQDELAEWYARADVFVLPSRSEPWGMVLNEAAAAALPLVATDAVGAAADLLEDGENGFCVRAGDAEALTAALERLVSDPELRRRAGRRSLELAAHFTPDAWAQELAALAEKVARS